MKHSYSFRRPDNIEQSRDWAIRKLTHYLRPEQREESVSYLDTLFKRWGPVVDSYPHWHPFVSHEPNSESPVTNPNRCFPGIDHSVFLRNAFISCPYDGAEQLIEKVEDLSKREFCMIEASPIDIPLYHEDATPVLVTCKWEGSLDYDELTSGEDAKNRGEELLPSENGFIPLRYALPLLLELELPQWESAQCAESWDDMKSYIIGHPCGAATSHFLSRSSIKALKTQWELLMNSGAYGPYRS